MKYRAAIINWNGDTETCPTVAFWEATPNEPDNPDGVLVCSHTYQSIDTALYAARCFLEGVGILDEETARAHMDADKP